MKISLQNIRSFTNIKEIEIKPLTLLVGENSSGKSTFIAALSAIERGVLFQYRPQFNNPPYDLGSFDTIATYKGGRYGRATSFTLEFQNDSGEKPDFVMARYGEDKGQPVLKNLEIKLDGNRILVNITDEKAIIGIELADEKREILEVEFSGNERNSFLSRLNRPQIGLSYLLFLLDSKVVSNPKPATTKKIARLIDEISMLEFTWRLQENIAIAPIRTKPRRTYDEIDDVYKPEGDHVPILISRILSGEDNRQKRALVETLKDYGLRSGLFKEVKSKRLGQRPSDPFQLRVTVAGREANIVDVGYGISQVLPILVESILSDPRRRVTMQQPEVHLHPRAQAALGSFLVDMTEKFKRQFVIETHSDYILDRVRQEVGAGKISPEKVAILFFDKPGIETAIYQLGLDNQGNIVNAPESYREFFMEEQINMLVGIAD